MGMNDYIDIGVFSTDKKHKNGRTQASLRYLRRCKFKRGNHELTFTVKGKPKTLAIDPFGYLIDRDPHDNLKSLE